MAGIQAKLQLGPAGDKYEQEADRVAAQVVRQMDHTPPVQRSTEEEELAQAKALPGNSLDLQRHFEPNAKTLFSQPPISPAAAHISRLQRAARVQFTKERFVQRHEEKEDVAQMNPLHGAEGGEVESSVAQQIQSARGGGQSLNDGIRAKMEQGFGADFSRVRVHTGGQADTLNRSLNARAFTVGKDVFFGKGQYNPSSSNGQKLLAHELTHTVQQGAVGVQRKVFLTTVQRQSGNVALIQRAPNTKSLEQKLGKNKYQKVVAAGQVKFFEKLTDNQLDLYKQMQNTKFEELIKNLQEGLLGTVGGKVANTAQVVDLLGAVVETGEEAAQIIPNIPQLLGSMSGMVSSGIDSGMEGFGGFTGGAKDTYEGGSSILGQQKYVEGGLTTLGGISGLLSVVPGIPDFVGMAGAGAKSLAGVTKIVNIRINQNAINTLRVDGSGNPALLDALDVLEARLDYWSYLEGGMQTGLGAMEGVGAFYGGLGKWMTGAISKGTETAYNWLPYLGRAVGSYTGLVDSNGTVKDNEKQEKLGGNAKMWDAVESVKSNGNPEHIGRLHRLAVLIEKDYAEVIDNAVNSLPRQLQTTVKDAIKKKATWNPS
ncbi:DUF4157 domain-containing protein [bacterium]|nr:DUF4157 domain-containing protein [bacterium]